MRTICPQFETQNEREAKFIQTTDGDHMGKSSREQLTHEAQRDSLAGLRWRRSGSTADDK